MGRDGLDNCRADLFVGSQIDVDCLGRGLDVFDGLNTERCAAKLIGDDCLLGRSHAENRDQDQLKLHIGR